MTSARSIIVPERVRRPWCVWVAVGLVLLGAVLNVGYLFNHCPLDLSPDEAHYWEWSRHLDYGYYSKPPGIAWVIAGAVRFAGMMGVDVGDGAALMPWVRLPAVVFGVMTGLVLIGLCRRVFRDDRAGLAVVVLSAGLPMFAIGGLLITIDSPMYFCWTVALYCLWRQVEGRGERGEGKGGGVGWLYGAAVFCAVGMLFKPLLVAFPICAVVAMGMSPGIRGRLKTVHSWVGLMIVLASQVPVVIWNSQHQWVTFRHMLGQAGIGKTGEGKAGGSAVMNGLMRELSYLGGQVGVMGGTLAVFLVLAVIHGFRRRGGSGEENTRYSFLLAFTLPLLGFYAVLAIFSNTEPNWPAAAYAAGMTLLAGVVTIHWNHADTKIRRTWRMWIAGTVALGVIFVGVALNLQRFYPLVAKVDTPLDKWPSPRKWDPQALKLRGNADQAAVVDGVVRALQEETGAKKVNVVAMRYDVASSLAFYMKGQPFVTSIASRTGSRMSQYDFWPELMKKENGGENVVVVSPAAINKGTVEDVIVPAFERVERDEAGKVKFERTVIRVNGVPIREVYTLKCFGFRGWPAAAGAPSF